MISGMLSMHGLWKSLAGKFFKFSDFEKLMISEHKNVNEKCREK